MSSLAKKSAVVMAGGARGHCDGSDALVGTGWPVGAPAAGRELPRQVVRGVERPRARMGDRNWPRRSGSCPIRSRRSGSCRAISRGTSSTSGSSRVRRSRSPSGPSSASFTTTALRTIPTTRSSHSCTRSPPSKPGSMARCCSRASPATTSRTVSARSCSMSRSSMRSPSPRGPGLNAIAATFVFGTGAVFRPLPVGEHTLVIDVQNPFLGDYHTTYHITVSPK